MAVIEHTQAKQNPQDEPDLGYLLAVCLDHRWTIVVVTALVTLMGYLHAWQVTPTYRADALLEVEQRSNLATIGNGAQYEQSTSYAQIEILRSRMIMLPAAQRAQLDLLVQPQYMPRIGAPLVRRNVERPEWAMGSEHAWAGDGITVEELRVEQALLGAALTLQVTGADSYQLLDPQQNLILNGRVDELVRSDNPLVELRVSRINAPANVKFTIVKRSDIQMIGALQGRFRVIERGFDTGILELTLTGPDREELQRSLDAIADVFVLQNINRQAAEAENRLAFLEQQMPVLMESLNLAENSLNEYRFSRDSVDLDFETRTMLEQLVSLESNLNALQLQETEIARRFTSSHPNYRSLVDRRVQLLAEIERLESQINNLPETQRQVLRLNRDVEVNQQIYLQMLNATQELRIVRAGTVGSVRILDRSVVGGTTIAPRYRVILFASMAAGLVISLVLVLLRQMLRRGVESVTQLQEMGLRVYATIPLSDRQTLLGDALRKRKRLFQFGKARRKAVEAATESARKVKSSRLLAIDAPADLAIEALRSLRAGLHFAMVEAPDNRLMLAGPSMAVGKSFVSTNLAAICAQSGQRVLLIDADLRKGYIHRMFGDWDDTGLSDYLVSHITMEQLIRETSVPGLFYAARGTPPPNPSDLLTTRGFRDLLDEVSGQFDLVIIDTPPTLAVADAAIVGKLCGTALMITRFRVSQTKEIERAIDQLDTAGVPIKGVVMNAIEKTASTYYGYGYGYYGYAYKSDK